MNRLLSFVLSSCLWGGVALPALFAQPEAEGDLAKESVIRVLPPRDQESSGRALVETLLIDPAVSSVIFYIDGEEAARRQAPPWEAKVKLASPAQEQRIRVEALDRRDLLLGFDEMIVNRVVRPLKVTIQGMDPTASGLRITADISVPREATLSRVEVFLNEEHRETFEPGDLVQGALVADLEIASLRPSDFVRVVAFLEDGRTIEDVELPGSTTFSEEIDVHLVQLQVVVTDSQDRPIIGLEKEHFEIRHNGKTITPAGVFAAGDVALLLGFALDSSGSMMGVWDEVRGAASDFLKRSLTEKDQGFLIDFDTQLKLVRPRTGNLPSLIEGLDELEPEGGTALYDSILYSMLQFDRQQGRRGLVILTDGFDIDSQADPKRAVEFGKKLGVPIYIVAMESGPPAVGGSAGSTGFFDSGAAVQTLHLLTDPTGGRLFRARTPKQISESFRHINAELRSQYVVTFYTDSPPEAGEPPLVRLTVPNRKQFGVKTVLGTDQIY